MTLAFSSTSARFALPLLYAAQAQKEVCVNEAFAIIDAVLQCAIEGIATVPPATPTEGTCWMVGTGGSGAWAGADGMIAAYQAGNWIMIAPRDGMVVLNLSNGQAMRHVAGWLAATAPALPSGGSTIDNEARTAIGELVAGLRAAGIFASA